MSIWAFKLKKKVIFFLSYFFHKQKGSKHMNQITCSQSIGFPFTSSLVPSANNSSRFSVILTFPFSKNKRKKGLPLLIPETVLKTKRVPDQKSCYTVWWWWNTPEEGRCWFQFYETSISILKPRKFIWSYWMWSCTNIVSVQPSGLHLQWNLQEWTAKLTEQLVRRYEASTRDDDFTA